MPRINSSFTARIRNPGRTTLHEYLTRRFTYHSSEEWVALLALGRLALEGLPAHGDETLHEGQSLRFAVVDYEEPYVPLDFKILLQERDLCLVHKPAEMPVHRTGKIFFQTLANLMRERLQDSSWSPLNRLDRETSGVVAFARGPEAFRSLAPDSPTAEWTKLYMAIVRGRLPSAGVGMGMEVGILDQPVGPQTGDAIRCRMHVHLHGKPATSLYQTMAHSEGLSLVVLSPVTGRKHQLRVHLAHAGCPVVGDKIYSGDGQAYLKRLEAELDEEDYAALGAKRHLLHAFYLRIKTPDHEIHEAWDWEPGPEFLQNFPNENPSTWHASGKLDQILSQVQ